MSRLDGKFIKPGSIPADRLDPKIPLGGEVPDGSVTPAKLAAGLLERLVVVSWGEATAGAPGVMGLELQLRDLAGEVLEAAHVLRVTCDAKATLTVGEGGTALSGDGTSDLIARTNAAGMLALAVSCTEEISVTVAAGPTQASPMLDCRTVAEVAFTQE
jgi:hypothetical protein